MVFGYHLLSSEEVNFFVDEVAGSPNDSAMILEQSERSVRKDSSITMDASAYKIRNENRKK